MRPAPIENMLLSTMIAALFAACDPHGLGSLPGAIRRASRPADTSSQRPSAPAPTIGEFFARPGPPMPTIEPVAMVGDPAPGLPPGFVYSYLSVPQIDASGNLLFAAFVDGPGVSGANNLADFYGPPGAVSKLVWESEPAFGIPGAVISYIRAESLAKNGLIALTLEVAGYGIMLDYNDEVICVGRPGEFVKVLQSADQAIDCPPGVYYDVAWGYFVGMLSGNGTLCFQGAVAGDGVTDPIERAVWIGLPDDLHLVYRDYMQAAQCPTGVLCAWADLYAFNDLGRLAFRAGLLGTGVTSANNVGHWFGGTRTLMKISRKGDPASLFGPGVTWNAVSLGYNTVNAWGDVNESAIIEGAGVTTLNDQVSLIATDDGFYLLGREGTPAPSVGTGVYVDYVASAYVNNLRHACFPVRYAGPGITEANQWAMYYGPYDAPVSVARDGEAAPMFPQGVLLARVRDLVGKVALNDVGDIVGPSEICGPGITDADKAVLWLRHHVLKRWVPLLRSGDELAGRTVYAASAGEFGLAYWGATGGADGMAQSLNDAGMLAIRLEFTEGTHGIFRILPPVFGDGDGDGQVGAGDLRLIEQCWTGPGGGAGPEPTAFDLDADGEIDLADLALLQQLLG